MLATRRCGLRSRKRCVRKSSRAAKALLTAKRYADEIAANYSHAFITYLASVLGRAVEPALRRRRPASCERVLHQVTAGNEIVYVPCHRSHMDYLLLSYIIYTKGFAVPHIAAGVNLNMPVIGRFLRKGGAFFLRRSFRGDSLYHRGVHASTWG